MEEPTGMPTSRMMGFSSRAPPLEKRREHRDPHGIKRSLRQLTFDILAGTMDEILSDFAAGVRGETLKPKVMNLVNYIKTRRKIVEVFEAKPANVARDLEATARSSMTELQIMGTVKILARLGLSEQVFAFFPRFVDSFPEEMASAFELLEVTPFDDSLNRILGSPCGFRRRHKLNYFRLAQRIRDEHGIRRPNSPPKSFCSFDDIIQLERKIADNDPVDFFTQCIALGLVDDRHMEVLFRYTSSHAELEAVYDAIHHRDGALSSDAVGCFMHCFRSFENAAPTWGQLKKYLGGIQYVDLQYGVLHGADILSEEVDDAFHCLLKHLVRIFSAFPTDIRSELLQNLIEEPLKDPIVGDLKVLLEKGASFLHIDSDGKYAVETFVELANIVHTLPLLEFLPYMCCPLSHDGSRVNFDIRAPAPLACIAARRVRPSFNGLLRNSEQQSWVRIHQKLQTHFERGCPGTEVPE